ncbi:MAG: hypothetical protein QXL50_00150 [Candidatus Pacearchaeota archaeon]
MPKENIDYEAFFTQLLQRINEIEEKSNINKNKIDLLSNSLAKKTKKINEEIELIRNDLDNIKQEIEKLKQRVEYIISEFPNLARKEDLISIEKFINLWQPLKFATLEDVEKMIEKKMKK